MRTRSKHENFSPAIKLGSCCTALLLSSNHNCSHQAAKGQNLSSFGRELCELFAYLHSPYRPYLSSVILVVCHFMDPRYHTNSKYLFKPKGALQESTDLWPQTPSVLAVVSLTPALINGSTNWWDLSNQVVVHMQGIFQGILVIPHICHGRHGRRPCKFFLAGINFYRFNMKNWRKLAKIGVFRCKFDSPKMLPV